MPDFSKLLDVNRELRPLAWPSIKDDRHAARFLVSELGKSRTWGDILQNPVSLIIGSAHCGKTSEFNLLVTKLRKEGKFAFFVPLRLVAQSGLEHFRSADNRDSFERWLTSDEDAVFFLDSVDEASLLDVHGAVTAVRRLRETLSERDLSRVRWVISSRCEFWNSREVLRDLAAELAVDMPEVSSDAAEPPAEDDIKGSGVTSATVNSLSTKA